MAENIDVGATNGADIGVGNPRPSSSSSILLVHSIRSHAYAVHIMMIISSTSHAYATHFHTSMTTHHMMIKIMALVTAMMITTTVSMATRSCMAAVAVGVEVVVIVLVRKVMAIGVNNIVIDAVVVLGCLQGSVEIEAGKFGQGVRGLEFGNGIHSVSGFSLICSCAYTEVCKVLESQVHRVIWYAFIHIFKLLSCLCQCCLVSHCHSSAV